LKPKNPEKSNFFLGQGLGVGNITKFGLGSKNMPKTACLHNE